MNPTKKPLGTVPRCHMPWQQMVIDSSGYVAPCCYWGAVDNDGGTSLGNFNAQTIEEIWNGPGYQKLRAGMAKGDLKAAGCAGCQAVKQGMGLGFEYDAACEREDGSPTLYAKNIALLKTEIAAGATVLDAKPTVVSYTPSHRCNIRCTHCYQETTRTAEINRLRADEDVEALAPYLVRIVAGGGEPFLLPIWRKFLTTFDFKTNPFLAFSTSTNATIVTTAVEQGLGRFKKLVINVSLDGTGAAFERVRIGANFIQVRDNIRKLKKVVARADDQGSALGVSMCVMKSNIHDLPNFVRFCTEEELSFGLWPVTALPSSESLRHFIDPWTEMKGWSEAIDEAEQLTHSLYLPRMARSRNAPEPHESEHEFWQNNFKLLREAIPFHLVNSKGQEATVVLPARVLTRFPGLTLGNTQLAFIYQLGETKNAPVACAKAQDGQFNVRLPEGRYCVNFSLVEGETPTYWDVVRFSIERSVQGPVKARYFALTRRRVEERLKRFKFPSEIAKVSNRLWHGQGPTGKT